MNKIICHRDGSVTIPGYPRTFNPGAPALDACGVLWSKERVCVERHCRMLGHGARAVDDPLSHFGDGMCPRGGWGAKPGRRVQTLLGDRALGVSTRESSVRLAQRELKHGVRR